MSVNIRSSGEVELGIGAQSDHKNRDYVIQLFRNPGEMSSAIMECVDDFAEIDCGWCKVSIDGNYWIRYQWYPNDPDPSASQARDDGEISWEEWEARNEAAQNACLRKGLAEQGYSFNDD